MRCKLKYISIRSQNRKPGSFNWDTCIDLHKKKVFASARLLPNLLLYHFFGAVFILLFVSIFYRVFCIVFFFNFFSRIFGAIFYRVFLSPYFIAFFVRRCFFVVFFIVTFFDLFFNQIFLPPSNTRYIHSRAVIAMFFLIGSFSTYLCIENAELARIY